MELKVLEKINRECKEMNELDERDVIEGWI